MNQCNARQNIYILSNGGSDVIMKLLYPLNVHTLRLKVNEHPKNNDDNE
jgi:hypothetical protein